MSDLKERVDELVGAIHYKPGYRLAVERDAKDPEGRVYLQVWCWRPDANTGEEGWGHGGKAYLSDHMINGEIVRIAFGLFMRYEEHECREFFLWHGRAVFGPHMAIDELWIAADPEKLEYRQ